ncbi:pyrimidodiazepine synthase-like [Pogonomyrmex barbatus]|uniref:Pyrimidodiazepine synthase-like n=1 Tax=Pogonomyrmex barbatus TaxID=144034 RepID=A0A6I9VZE1_9HYME|nr:pyrimidodiazepine synthase-like [Pogonomyrmex barbatus]
MSTKHLSTDSALPPLVPDKIRLYSMRFCPYAQRIHLILDAKQIPYDVVYVNLTNKPNWLIEKSPLNKVPCIELEEGKTLYESLIIAEYLDEAYPENKLFPSNPLAKAQDKLLIDRFHAVISSMYKALYLEAELAQDMFNDVLNDLQFFNRELVERKTPFFGGKEPGMVDYMIWPWYERADVLKLIKGEQFTIQKNSVLQLIEWIDAMKDNPVVKKSFLKTEIHAKYVRSRLAGTPQYDFI